MTLKLSSNASSGRGQLHISQSSVKSNFKSLLICFFDTSEIIHKECIPPCQVFNGEFHHAVLRQLREDMRRKHDTEMTGPFTTKAHSFWWKQHDDCSSYTVITRLGSMQLLSLFLVKIDLKSQIFDTTEESQAELQMVLNIPKMAFRIYPILGRSTKTSV